MSSITKASFGLTTFSKWDEVNQNKRGVRWHIFLGRVFQISSFMSKILKLCNVDSSNVMEEGIST
jgi:hypothetical protein